MPKCKVSESSDKRVPYRVTLENSWLGLLHSFANFLHWQVQEHLRDDRMLNSRVPVSPVCFFFQ